MCESRHTLDGDVYFCGPPSVMFRHPLSLPWGLSARYAENVHECLETLYKHAGGADCMLKRIACSVELFVARTGNGSALGIHG